MATPAHTPMGRGFDTSIGYLWAYNGYLHGWANSAACPEYPGKVSYPGWSRNHQVMHPPPVTTTCPPAHPPTINVVCLQPRTVGVDTHAMIDWLIMRACCLWPFCAVWTADANGTIPGPGEKARCTASSVAARNLQHITDLWRVENGEEGPATGLNASFEGAGFEEACVVSICSLRCNFGIGTAGDE